MAQPLSNDFSDLGGQQVSTQNDYSDLGGTVYHDFSDLGGVEVADSKPSLTPETDKALTQSREDMRPKVSPEIQQRVHAFIQGLGIPTSLEEVKSFLTRSPIQDIKDIAGDVAKIPEKVRHIGETISTSPAATVAKAPLSPEAFKVYGTATGMLAPAVFEKLRGGETDASGIRSTTQVPELEVRPQVGEETPLRPAGETARAQTGTQPEPASTGTGNELAATPQETPHDVKVEEPSWEIVPMKYEPPEPTVDAAPAKVNSENGSGSPPPPKSLLGDTPPGSNPEKTWAQRLTTKFKNWWEDLWPRTYAAFRKEPDTPVITVHQQFIKDPVDFMESFADQPWWKNLKSMDEKDIIDAEDQAVSRYRNLVERGADPVKARALAVYESPLKDVFLHRHLMIPLEEAAAKELGVEIPGWTGDPYLARLTNEEGKELIDLTPNIPNMGQMLRRSIGHFDNSRVHATMKAGIDAGTQYDPVTKAVWTRERTGQQLITTANAVKALREQGVLNETESAAKAAQVKGTKETPVKVRGLGPKDYWARNRQEAKFIQQNFASAPSMNAGWRKLNQIGNAYVRNPSLINPLPHITKNMFFKYIMARVGNSKLKADVQEFASASEPQLKARFDKVFPVRESAIRMPQLTAREVGNWAERVTSGGLKINEPSQKYIFEKADPAMRYSLWKSYVRKGMSDQEAANHVFLDLIRYDENSGGLNFWKSIPLNYFSTWRTGTFVTMAKALRSHPYRTLLFLGGVEYLREAIYRKTGKWTHLPIDYLEAPLSEVVFKSTQVPEQIEAGRSPLKAMAAVPESAAGVAATTLLFGPGGGQAPSTISDVMNLMRGDPMQKARVQNMFWGFSQLFGIPQEYLAYKRDGNPEHFVNILTAAAFGTHSALKYEPRRLGKWLPEWMPGMQKSEIVKEAEDLQARLRQRQEKGQATYESKHGLERSFQYGEQEQQLEELRHGVRPSRGGMLAQP